MARRVQVLIVPTRSKRTTNRQESSMNKPYRVGDRIVQRCFGDPRCERYVTVTAKIKNIKNGRNGFDGRMDNGAEVWGYDEDVAYVLLPRP